MREVITLEGLKRDFESRYHNSRDKDSLLSREKDGYEAIFNDKRLKLRSTSVIKNNDKFDWPKKYGPRISFFGSQVLKEYGIKFWDWELTLIRAAYYYFIVDGNDIAEAGNWYKGIMNWSDEAQEEMQIKGNFYANLAEDLYCYIGWLKEFSAQETTSIIEKEVIIEIFKEYYMYFKTESKESWMNRFLYPNSKPIAPINITRDSREDSNRLILLGILCSIHDDKMGMLDFNAFVRDRFGLKGFETAKSRYKYTSTAQKAFKKCNSIIKNARI